VKSFISKEEIGLSIIIILLNSSFIVHPKWKSFVSKEEIGNFQPSYLPQVVCGLREHPEIRMPSLYSKPKDGQIRLLG
jgi:hypothetical protein